MKVTVRICRAAKVPTQFLRGCVGADVGDSPDTIYSLLKKNYGSLAPGIDFYVESGKTLVTKEVMAFNIQAKDTPFARGMTTADMLSEREIARMDGALESELNRLGIMTQPDDYEWRALYEVEE